jgi:hypothetical protein
MTAVTNHIYPKPFPRYEVTLGLLRPKYRRRTLVAMLIRHLIRQRKLRDLGWELVEVDSGGGEDEYGLPPCPECGKPPVTSIHQYWDNVDTEDCVGIDLYWCADKHIWGDCLDIPFDQRWPAQKEDKVHGL